MSRSAGFSVENNFSKALVTEATGLNFPENAVTDTDNCVYEPKGTVHRRKGFAFEDNHVGRTVPIQDQVYSEYLWESVAGDGNLSFLVQQIGDALLIYRSDGGETLSANFLTSISLNTFALAGPTFISTNFCQFSTGLGRLIVVHPHSEPFYLTYEKETGIFFIDAINVLTRDFRGVEPQGVGRSSSVTLTHLYNLANQGWSFSRSQDMFGKTGLWPSDFDVWWLYKAPDAFGVEVFLPSTAVAAGIINNLDRGNSPAPKGSMILAEFYQDRSAASGSGGIPVVTAGIYRPSTTAFHAGRVFYAGVNYKDFSSKIYFSQILEGVKQFGKCHQENDPTSQFTADLLPTDGGVIAIPDVGTVYKLWAVDNSLLVFSSQGVWQITGSQGIGFSAIDYTVKKISTAATLSAQSFVNMGGMPVWWGLDDIFIAASDPQLGSLSVQSLSAESIKTFFQAIPEESKRYAKGAYNNREHVIQWLYRDLPGATINERQSYTKILNLNTESKAFYPWSVPLSSVFIKGISVLKGQGSTDVASQIVDGLGNTVVDGSGNNVVVMTELNFTLSAQFKYSIVYAGNQFSFGNEGEIYLDWDSELGDGIPFTSFLTTGYKLRGEAIRKWQENYLRVFIDRSEESSDLFLNARWDYANTGNVGRWSSRQRLEFDGSGYGYVNKRVKIRGHGLALQFNLTSVENAGFNVVGWTGFETANERV